MASDTDKELHQMMKSIVDDLEAAVSGKLYVVDGNYEIIDDIDDWKAEQYAKKVDEFRKEHPEANLDKGSYDTYEEWMEDEIGTVDDIDEPDNVSLSGYLDKESLGDVRFEVDSEMEIRGGKLLFTYGGPNIWVAADEVRGYWGSSAVKMPLDSDTRSAMFGWFRAQWDCVKG